MEHSPAAQKAALRQHLRSHRRALGPARDGEALAEVLAEVLSARGIPAEAVVAGFLPTVREPDVLPFLADRCARGAVVMPRTLVGFGLEWVPWRPGGPMIADRHGLRAPAGEPDPAVVHRLRALLVPALAIDPAGHRLGQGGGYYDRALQDLPRWPAGPLRIGVVHPEGMVAGLLPHAPHDATVDIGACSQGWWTASGTALSP